MDIEQLLEVMLTSASGTEQKLVDAPSIATVITAKQIEHSSARTLSEVLALVPGLKVYLAPSEMQKSAYDIRGLRDGWNSQILTLINGVSIDQAVSGTPLARLTIDGTEGVVDGSLTDVSDTDYVFFSGATRKIFFASAQDVITISDDWSFTAGLRYDNYSDFGDTINPRAALVWKISPQVSSKLLYGRAFRAPTYSEL